MDSFIEPLPYSLNAGAGRAEGAPEPTNVAGIPFELSDTFHHATAGGRRLQRQHEARLPAIDWDSLHYDFQLEKSIVKT